MTDGIGEAVRKRKHEWVSFCRTLIQTPSPTYGEEDVARLIIEEMKKLRYDDVWRDARGNVLGLFKGTDPGAPDINLNSHMDQVATEARRVAFGKGCPDSVSSRAVTT